MKLLAIIMFQLLLICMSVQGWADDRKINRICEDRLSVVGKNLEVRSLYVPKGYRFFLKKNIFTGEEKSWNEVYHRIVDAYKAGESFVEKWPLKEELKRPAFILAVVTNMWRVGKPGQKINSVRSYYLNAHPKERIIPVRAYLENSYADCNDFATMLYMMLKLDGLSASHVGTPDHIYVQASIGDSSYILDALYGFFTELDKNEFLERDIRSKNVYYLVPYGGEYYDSEIFRPTGGSMRFVYMLTRGRFRRYHEKKFDHWNRFDIWLKLNGVANDGNIEGLNIR